MLEVAQQTNTNRGQKSCTEPRLGSSEKLQNQHYRLKTVYFFKLSFVDLLLYNELLFILFLFHIVFLWHFLLCLHCLLLALLLLLFIVFIPPLVKHSEKCSLNKNDKYAQLLRSVEGTEGNETVDSLYFKRGDNALVSGSIAPLRCQRLSQIVRQHGPLLNVLSACLWLSVFHAEVCHFTLWSSDLIPCVLRDQFFLFSLCKVYSQVLNVTSPGIWMSDEGVVLYICIYVFFLILRVKCTCVDYSHRKKSMETFECFSSLETWRLISSNRVAPFSVGVEFESMCVCVYVYWPVQVSICELKISDCVQLKCLLSVCSCCVSPGAHDVDSSSSHSSSSSGGNAFSHNGTHSLPQDAFEVSSFVKSETSQHNRTCRQATIDTLTQLFE